VFDEAAGAGFVRSRRIGGRAMTVRINLLPHREQKRQTRQRQFVSISIGLAILSLAVVGLVHVYLAARIDDQESRNKLLKGEIAKLDEQIKEIDRLREQTQALLSRKQVVETLQLNRTEAVHLLDQMVRQLPDGIYLKSVKQVNTKVTLVGYAQSNARVSTLMRNIESSPWLEKPELVEIKSIPVPNQKEGRINEFTLNLSVKRVTPPSEPLKPATPPNTATSGGTASPPPAAPATPVAKGPKA
jgi:type IV pilus assembly protein PilN